MWDIGKNLGNTRMCAACNSEEESVEHIMKCNKFKEHLNTNIENLNIQAFITNCTLEVTQLIKQYMDIRESKNMVE